MSHAEKVGRVSVFTVLARTYRKTCFWPRGGRKRSGSKGRKGSWEGFFLRAGFRFIIVEAAFLTIVLMTDSEEAIGNDRR